MEAPGFFILLAIFLALLFGACMVTGAVWLFFGLRKKARSVQFLAALPFGVGLFIIGPLLLLAVGMVVWWFLADWRGISPPAAPQQGKPNQSLQPTGTRAGAQLPVAEFRRYPHFLLAWSLPLEHAHGRHSDSP